MDKVQKSLNDLERRLTKSNKIVSKGDKIGYTDAIKLGRKSNGIVSSINKGIKEYDGTTPSDAESKAVLGQMQTIITLTEQQLAGLQSNKGTFDKLKVGGLVKKNIGKTEVASKELSALMLSKAPADLKAEAEALEQRRAAAFQKTNAVYEGASGGENDAEGDDDSD